MPRGRNELQRRVLGHCAASLLIQSPQQLHRLQQWIRVGVGAKGERLQERRRKFSDVAVAMREEIKVTIVQRAHHAKNTSRSDFRIQELMNYVDPISLYIVTKPNDKARLKPLVRIVVNMIVRLRADKLDFENGRPKPS